MSGLRLVGASERAPAGTRQVTASGSRQAYAAGGRHDTGRRKIGRMVTGDRTCGVCGIPHAQPCGILRKHLDLLRLKGQSEGTVYSRERAIARMVVALDPVPVIEADADELAVWRAGLTVTDSTTVQYVSHAKEFIGWAADEGLRIGNPAAGLPIPRLGRRLPRPIGEADLMAALTAAPPRIRPWLVLAGWCGLRACEIANLRRENIMDTVTPPVIIVAADATKGHAAERVIPMSAFVLAEMRAAGLPPGGYAFRRADGQYGPNQAWTISQMSNRHLHDCGTGATLHQLRHRMLSEAYKATLDLRLVQDLAGHSSPVTTSGYAQFARAQALVAVEALGVPG